MSYNISTKLIVNYKTIIAKELNIKKAAIKAASYVLTVANLKFYIE